jgi:hypothetical protein
MYGYLSRLLLRAGVAFAFLFPPINALFYPEAWIGYFPQALHAAATNAGISDLVLLHSFGALEVVIAVWVLWGRKAYIPAAAAVAILLAIVATDLSDFQILFRDIALALCAAAVAADSWYNEHHV